MAYIVLFLLCIIEEEGEHGLIANRTKFKIGRSKRVGSAIVGKEKGAKTVPIKIAIYTYLCAKISRRSYTATENGVNLYQDLRFDI